MNSLLGLEFRHPVTQWCGCSIGLCDVDVRGQVPSPPETGEHVISRVLCMDTSFSRYSPPIMFNTFMHILSIDGLVQLMITDSQRIIP